MALMTTTSPENETAPQPELLLANWQGEMDSADLYRFLATRENDESRATLMREMAESETRHARVMEHGLAKQDVSTPPHKLGFKTRLLKSIARLFGPGTIYPLLHGMEVTAGGDYALQDKDVAALANEERTHARSLGAMSRRDGGVSERWHRSAGGGTLRAS